MAEERIRSFVAIEIDQAQREHLEALTQRLRKCPVRAVWVRPENMHLTLRFLGEVERGLLDKLSARLESEYDKLRPISARMRGIGAFPNVRRARVVWTAVEASDGALEQLQDIAERGAREAGLAAEKKPFQAHVTLGRIKGPDGLDRLAAVLEREAGFDGGEFTIDHVALFRSELTPRGAVYTRLNSFSFRWTSTSD